MNYLSEYETQLSIQSSMCDFTGCLSIPDTFALFMDIATMHADALGIGLKDMSKNDLFWLTVKSKIHINRRIHMGEEVTAFTWPEKAKGLRCMRDYLLKSGDDELAYGKTQWAVINMKTGKLYDINSVYPKGLETSGKSVMDDSFERFNTSFEGTELSTYKIRSTDIDIGGHMNNIAYIRAVIGCFSTQQLKLIDPKDIEIIYRAQCFEGDELRIMLNSTDNTHIIQAVLPDSTVAVQMIMRSA